MRRRLSLHRGIFYTPLDELLDHPVVRILRAIRHLGWIGPRELFEVVLELGHESKAATNNYTAHVLRLLRAGHLQRRLVPELSYSSAPYEYSITDAGRDRLVELLALSQPERELAGRSEHDRTFRDELTRRDCSERAAARRRSA